MNPIVRKELIDAFRNRWVIGYAILLGILGVFAAWVGLKSSGGMVFQMFGRTSATITNLSLLLAPLVAALLGATSIAGEREKGTLERLLAQPISPAQLVTGKFLGLVLAIAAATMMGFTPAGVLIAVLAPASLPLFLLFPFLVVPVAAAMAGLGMMSSVSSTTAAKSLGNAVVIWFSLVLFYDLVLMGTLMVLALPPAGVAALLVINPVDAARTLLVLLLEPDLHILGPAGAVLVTKLGRWGAAGALVVVLVTWSIVPLLIARRAFDRALFASDEPSVTHDATSPEYLLNEISAGPGIR